MRLRPLTAAVPKPMLPLFGIPFAAGLLHQLTAAGATRITILVGADPTPWRHLAASHVEIQPEEIPLGTAGGLRRLFARRPPREPVLVCNGDVLVDLDHAALLAAHRARAATATVALARAATPSSFGVLVRDRAGWVREIVEKPRPGTEPADTVNIGSYVLAPDVFADLPGDGPLAFEHDLLPALVTTGTLLGVVVRGYWQDLGTPARYLEAHRAVLDGRCPWPAPATMRITPGLRAVDSSARIHSSATIGPMAVVGAGCVVGVGASVVRSVLHEGVRVGARARIVDSVLGARTRIAPGTEVVAAVLG